MAAYIIVDINIKDPAGYEEYKVAAAESLKIYGGKYLVRGGKTQVLEGSWLPNRMVLLEFSDAAHAKQWWDSPEYAPARKIRWATAETNMIVVEGV